MKAKTTLSRIALTLILSTASILADITVDTTFNPGTGGDGLVETTIVQPNGKILICGNFTTFNNTSNAYIARLNSDGSVDDTFHADVGYWVRHMALQSDGKIVIGGFFSNVEGISRRCIARLNANGSLDTSFDPGQGCQGRLVPADPTDPYIFAVAVQGDGKILLGGNFVTYDGTTNNGIARVNSDGSLDTSFQVGQGVNSWVRSMFIQSDHRIMLTGWFTSYDNQPHSRMVLLNTNGTAVATFNPDFGELTSVYTAFQLSNGKYVVAGHSANTNDPGYFEREIARLNTDGSFDTNFTAVANEKIESIRQQSDGKIVMGGYFTQVDGHACSGLARLNADGSFDSTLTNRADNFVWHLEVQGDKILACGGFNTIDGVSRPRIVRLAPAGSTNTNTPPPSESSLPTVYLQNAAGQVAVCANGSWSHRVMLNNNQAFLPGSRIVAVSDFNSDNQADFITQTTAGVVSISHLNGTNIVDTARLGEQPDARQLKIAGFGDFDHDGQKDLLLKNATGKLTIWYLSGTNVVRTSGAANGRGPGAAWAVVGVNDFNHDDSLDILWQNTAGVLAVWTMNSTNFVSSTLVRNGKTSGPAWRMRGLSDVNHDSQTDFIWQNTNGQLAVWLMSGVNLISSSVVAERPPAAWKVVGVQ